MTALLIVLWSLVALALATAILGLIIPAHIQETPILHCFHWREWRLKAGDIWYDGHHYYLWVGPLVLSIDP